MKNIIQATARGGVKVYLNISDEACMRFGFKYGQRIIDPRDDKGVVMGVAPAEPGAPDVLWFAFDCDEGEVCYWDVNVDLEQEGFKRTDITTEEVLSEMVICFRVVASTNRKTETVIVRDVAIAAAQGRVFRQAGHKDFSVSPVMVLFDKCGTRGDVFGEEFIESAVVYDAPVPSRYQRADIYPGINVNDYDRDVLERRVTGVQVAVVIVVTLALLVGILLIAVAVSVMLGKLFNSALVGLGLSIAFLVLLMRKKEPTTMERLVACGMWVAGVKETDR